MAAEARRRGLTRAVVGDAAALPFADGSFDAGSADRAFQHLAEPAAALRELVRVIRPGGRLVVVDPTTTPRSSSAPTRNWRARCAAARADHALRNGSLAHRMAGRFAAAGLCDIRVEARTLIVRDPAAVDNVMGLRTWAESAHARGILSADEAARWPAMLDEAIAAGRFLYAVTFFLTRGVKAG